jgi:hypothetical protein
LGTLLARPQKKKGRLGLQKRQESTCVNPQKSDLQYAQQLLASLFFWPMYRIGQKQANKQTKQGHFLGAKWGCVVLRR